MDTNLRISIIAEVGVNHNGDLETAKDLIEVASQSGADYVKFQSFNADELVTRDAVKASYQIDAMEGDIFQYQMLKDLSLSYEEHLVLKEFSDAKNICFISTAFDTEFVDFLADLGQKIFKVPSGEITNLLLLKHIGAYGYPVLLSTGMAELEEVKEAVTVLESSGTPKHFITVLHCTSAYPTPVDLVNLNAMCTIRDELNVAVGYSDHTLGTDIAIAAAALGATVIEKHLTLDRTMRGPDHKASVEPEEFNKMVSGVRNIEYSMGDGRKIPTESELENRDNVRRSIVVKHAVARGERFTAENLSVKRPGTGISPMRWDEVLGRLAIRDFEADEMLEI